MVFKNSWNQIEKNMKFIKIKKNKEKNKHKNNINWNISLVCCAQSLISISINHHIGPLTSVSFKLKHNRFITTHKNTSFFSLFLFKFIFHFIKYWYKISMQTQIWTLFFISMHCHAFKWNFFQWIWFYVNK